MTRRPAALLAVAAVLATAAAALVAARTRHRVPPQRYNVVLLSVDTLRRDALGCYGAPGQTSPAIDRFRADAVRFADAVAHSSSTLMSHASLLTSLVPQAHGARYARPTALPAEVTTLAEVFARNGYATAAINGGGQLAPELGLAQGFDLYQVLPGEAPFRVAVARALDWIGRVRARPFFLFLHTYEVHHPYTPHPRELERLDGGYEGDLPGIISIDLLRAINGGRRAIDAADAAHIRAAYLAEVRSVDAAFGDLRRGLDDLGIGDRTIVVLTSDHGEEFGEHGKQGWHSHTLYDELLRVPLLLGLPRRAHAGEDVPVQVRGIDVAPTLLGLCGIAVPPEYQGADLMPLLHGARPESRPALSQQDTPGREHVALRTGRHKLYDRRLFDLGLDPGETRDIARGAPAVAADLARVRDALTSGEGAAAAAVALEPETIERLRSLGYVE